MKIGLGLYTLQRPADDRRSFSDMYREMLAQARLAEEVGLDSIWFSEHHFCDDGYLASVLPICAAVAAETSRIRIGTGPAIAAFYNPVRLAEDIIALDLLSQGRFIPCLGLGYRQIEFEGMGIPPESDFARLEEIVEILRLAFTGEPFAFNGRHYRVPTVRVTPPPFTVGGPPLMLAGDHVMDRDAHYAGQNSACYMLDPSLSWKEVVRLVGIYDAALPPGVQRELPVFTYGFVADGAAAWPKMEAGFTYLRKTYDIWQGKPATDDRLDPGDYRLVSGTPDQLVDQIGDYHRQFGDRLHFILRLNYPGMEACEIEDAIRLLGLVAARVASDAVPD